MDDDDDDDDGDTIPEMKKKNSYLIFMTKLIRSFPFLSLSERGVRLLTESLGASLVRCTINIKNTFTAR